MRVGKKLLSICLDSICNALKFCSLGIMQNSLLSWELRVIGWDVSYGAEFVPTSEGSYTVIIQKARKVASSEEPVLCNNYKIGEPGKVVLTIDNQSSKKKKLLYRLKVKPSSD